MINPHIPVNELYPQYPYFTTIKKYKKPAFSKMNLAKKVATQPAPFGQGAILAEMKKS
jgi:hypothetical protein